MIHRNKFSERNVDEKHRTILCRLKVILLVAIAGSIGLSFVSQPSWADTPKGLTEADLKNIDEMTQIAMNAAVAGNFDAWAAIFVDDAVINPPNEPAVKGRDAIRAWMKKLPPITEFKLINEKIEGRDDLGYVVGTYTMTMTIPGAPKPVIDSGKFVTILRKQPDGRWLCAVDMFSSDLPQHP